MISKRLGGSAILPLVLAALASAACGGGKEPGPAASGSAASSAAGLSAADKERIRRFWGHLGEGNRLRTEGKPEAAIAEFESALAIDPRHEDSLYGLGNCLLDLGREAEAQEAFRRLVAVNPSSSRGNLQLGALAVDPASPLYDPKSAHASFEAAHRINGEETGPLLGMAEAALLAGDDAEARRRVDEVLVAHPGSRKALFLRGWFRSRSGDAAGAAADLDGSVGDALVVHAKRADAQVASEGDTKKGSAAHGATSDVRIRGLVSSTLDRLGAEKKSGKTLDVAAVYRELGDKVAAARKKAGATG